MPNCNLVEVCPVSNPFYIFYFKDMIENATELYTKPNLALPSAGIVFTLQVTLSDSHELVSLMVSLAYILKMLVKSQ